jgi:flagellar biosynthesis/type III secretory pathway protein FliH
MTGLFLRNFESDEGAMPRLREPTGTLAEPMHYLSENELLEQLARARLDGFAEGKLAGDFDARKAMAVSESAKAQELTASILTQLEALSHEDAVRRLEMERDTADLLLALAERILPDFVKNNASDLVSERVFSGLKLAGEGALITISVAAENVDRVREDSAAWAKNGFKQPKIEIQSDPTLSQTTVRIDWQNGYLDYDIDSVSTATIKILRRAVSKMNEHLKKAR